jgi:lipopolysaccharide/colanic/teichoic acid biosynthesis glycosyltransferase
MKPDRCLSLFLLLVLALPSCVATRAERRVSAGMPGAEVKRVLGQPYSQSRTTKDGVPVELWLFREVQSQSDGRKVLVDSAVSLRDGRVVEVSALKETPVDEAAVPAAAMLGRE